jgi:hypothetical protein
VLSQGASASTRLKLLHSPSNPNSCRAATEPSSRPRLVGRAIPFFVTHAFFRLPHSLRLGKCYLSCGYILRVFRRSITRGVCGKPSLTSCIGFQRSQQLTCRSRTEVSNLARRLDRPFLVTCCDSTLYQRMLSTASMTDT